MDKAALDAAMTSDPMLNQAIRGFWKDSGTDEVVNVLLSESDLATFQTTHAADIAAIYGWVQGTGMDNLDTFETVPQGVLDLMNNHDVYDINGDLVSSTPPTFNTPNWGHVFLGQKERIFAGEFSNEFAGEFL